MVIKPEKRSTFLFAKFKKKCYSCIMDKDYLKEKLNSLRTEMNHLWTGILVTFGGAIGFCTIERINIIIGIFIISGFIMGILFINAYIIRRIDLIKTIKHLKMEVNNELD